MTNETLCNKETFELEIHDRFCSCIKIQKISIQNKFKIISWEKISEINGNYFLYFSVMFLLLSYQLKKH